MFDYLVIGSVPCEEDCAQVGSENYRERMVKETNAYMGQLIRMFGEPPINCNLRRKSFPHDFGTYHEVCVIYDPEDEKSVEYAYKLEGDGSMRWDEIARKELGLPDNEEEGI